MEDQAIEQTELQSYSDPPYLTPPTRDHLSLLPAEILSHIFQLVAQHPTTRLHPSTGPSLPICKTLLPYTRASLYRRVNLSTLNAIRHFARTLKERPELGLLVDELKLDLVAEEESKLDEEEMYDLLARLDALRVFVVGCSKIARFVLAEWFMATFCPELEILSFSSRKALDRYPLSPYAAFRYIDLHPTVRSVRLSALGNQFVMATLPNPSTSATVSAVKELYLEGWLDRRSFREIARTFDKLEHLSLLFTSPDWGSPAPAFDLLQSIPCRLSLTHLTLHVPQDQSQHLLRGDVPPLDLPNLTHLTWDLKLPLPEMMDTSQLRTLTFGVEYPGAYIVHDISTILVDSTTGAIRLPHLQIVDYTAVDTSPLRPELFRTDEAYNAATSAIVQQGHELGLGIFTEEAFAAIDGLLKAGVRVKLRD